MNISEITKKYDFRFSKKYGQNFIGDENLLSAIVNDAQITEEDVVLEIGPGAGTLTRQIAKRAKRVVAYEIDKTLEPILDDTLADIDNVEVIFDDIMEVSEQEIRANVGDKFKIVANLPYYITTPILFKFLSSSLGVVSFTVMVQKEVAERICAKPHTSDYGALTVSVALKGEASIPRIVNRNNFTPPPNVDSAIVKIDLKKRYDIMREDKIDALVRGAFAMKRKTLVNNLCSSLGFSRVDAEKYLAQLNLKPTVRAEELSAEQFAQLCNVLYS
ncbi:MAG: 16S rRNA (adenine(1518)-N(6)/adenine(1519)-N(6))-dimethyltransferase RsmA [Clostridiales bacterium]|nr:16S rRNA (adenine(1518)-N(6)/adenine(1519)-N(6))-dimethyltransferase RsmA [Clostridiales bacterium]